MSAARSLLPPDWRLAGTIDLLQAALWFQNDAAYLYASARAKIGDGAPASNWVVAHWQEAAAHSAALAALFLDAFDADFEEEPDDDEPATEEDLEDLRLDDLRHAQRDDADSWGDAR